MKLIEIPGFYVAACSGRYASDEPTVNFQPSPPVIWNCSRKGAKFCYVRRPDFNSCAEPTTDGRDPSLSYITVTMDWSSLIQVGINSSIFTVAAAVPPLDTSNRPFIPGTNGTIYQEDNLFFPDVIQLQVGQHWEAQVGRYSITQRNKNFLDVLGIVFSVRLRCSMDMIGAR